MKNHGNIEAENSKTYTSETFNVLGEHFSFLKVFNKSLTKVQAQMSKWFGLCPGCLYYDYF